jgi:hypothetical protein
MPTQLQKAFLEHENGTQIPCMFSPAKLSFTAENRWQADHIPGRGAPELRYVGGGGGSCELSLVFDTTADGTAVTAHTQKLQALLAVDKDLAGFDATRNSGRPPWVRFVWGSHLRSFKAVVTRLSITYTYFSGDGIPLRANVEMSLEQYEPDENFGAQNPTSGTPRPERSHQVQPGDTLDRVAARYYADATAWRRIASVNGVRDPLALQAGTVLSIPDREG